MQFQLMDALSVFIFENLLFIQKFFVLNINSKIWNVEKLYRKSNYSYSCVTLLNINFIFLSHKYTCLTVTKLTFQYNQQIFYRLSSFERSMYYFGVKSGPIPRLHATILNRKYENSNKIYDTLYHICEYMWRGHERISQWAALTPVII